LKFILISLLIVSISFGSDKVLASCSNAKTELLDLSKETTAGYTKDSMTINLIIRGEKTYVQSKIAESELIYLGGTNSQFLEKVVSGHNVLYTYFEKSKILTVQKSYDLFGAIMVNTYLECK